MRSPEALRRHYEIERELADRLRGADRDERLRLYSEVYDELFRRVPDHTQLNVDLEEQSDWLAAERARLAKLISPGSTFLEIGAGDCALSIALDVSEEIVPRDRLPANVEVVVSDGRSIPVPEGTVDVAYSNQLMELLHPEDAREQLENIVRALRPGGRYVVITPHRYSGPHDISAGFDEEATGFHLKEYTNAELASVMRAVGFSRVQVRLSFQARAWTAPAAPTLALERLLGRLPAARRRKLARSGLRRLLGVAIVATR